MRTSTVAVSALAVLGLALAGCAEDDPAPEPTTPPTPPAPTAAPTPDATGTVASCLVGDWRSTGVGEEVGGDAAGLRLSGGSGVGLSIGPDGATTIDFSDMAPIDFTGQVAGVDVDGSLGYAGQAAATVHTDTDADSGSWEPAETDWSQARVTLDLTEPVEARPLDDTPFGERLEEADEVTGEVIDIDPILSQGRYECQDQTTLVVTSGDDTGLTWTFTRS